MKHHHKTIYNVIIKQFKSSFIWGMLGCWPHIHTPPNTSGSRAYWHHNFSNGNAITFHTIPRIRLVVFQSKAWHIDFAHRHWWLNFASTSFPDPNSHEINKTILNEIYECVSLKMHVALSVWPRKNCFELVLLHQIQDRTTHLAHSIAHLSSLFFIQKIWIRHDSCT